MYPHVIINDPEIFLRGADHVPEDEKTLPRRHEHSALGQSTTQRGHWVAGSGKATAQRSHHLNDTPDGRPRLTDVFDKTQLLATVKTIHLPHIPRTSLNTYLAIMRHSEYAPQTSTWPIPISLMLDASHLMGWDLKESVANPWYRPRMWYRQDPRYQQLRRSTYFAAVERMLWAMTRLSNATSLAYYPLRSPDPPTADNPPSTSDTPTRFRMAQRKEPQGGDNAGLDVAKQKRSSRWRCSSY